MNNDSEHKGPAVAITILFHAFVIAWLYFSVLQFVPHFGESGILVNFGDSDTGLGNEEFFQMEEPQPAQTPEPVGPDEEDMALTQDIEESVTVEKPKAEPQKPAPVVPKPVVAPEPAAEPVEPAAEPEPVVEERKPNPRALFPGRSSDSSTSQGIAGGSGNQGKPEGDPSSDNYEGTGLGNGGNGISFDLSGRVAQSLPVPEYNSRVEGIVIVEVVVDREGRVTSALAGVKGSTTTDSRLLDSARRAALASRFNRQADATAQKGTITYVFRFQN